MQSFFIKCCLAKRGSVFVFQLYFIVWLYMQDKDCKAVFFTIGSKCSSRYASDAGTDLMQEPYSERILHTLLNSTGV